jgi:YVTN family beta-propeller protein
VAEPFSNIVTVIDGHTNCVIDTIEVDMDPRHLAVDKFRNMIYVSNFLSGTVSAINMTTNNLTTVIQMKVNPANSGYLQCNNNIVHQNFTRYDIGVKLECKANAFKGYEFSSWGGDFASNVISNGESNLNNNSTIKFEASRYGTLNANFIQSTPVTIPSELWGPIYGIIPALFVSTLVPLFIKRNKEKEESKRYLRYYRSKFDKIDKQTFLEEVDRLYNDGKINESDYSALKNEFNHFQD